MGLCTLCHLSLGGWGEFLWCGRGRVWLAVVFFGVSEWLLLGGLVVFFGCVWSGLAVLLVGESGWVLECGCNEEKCGCLIGLK